MRIWIPQPDGVFDYVEGFTVVSSQARIIFPLLEPFGKDLDSLAFKNSQSLAKDYIFHQLYDTIKEVAKTLCPGRQVLSQRGGEGDSQLRYFSGRIQCTAGFGDCFSRRSDAQGKYRLYGRL